MTITKCDRCEKEIKLKRIVQLYKGPNADGNYEEHELCESCFDYVRRSIRDYVFEGKN